MKTIFIKPQSIERKWYLIDAEGQSLGRVAAAAAKIIKGNTYLTRKSVITLSSSTQPRQKSPATKWKIRFIIAIQCIQADSRLSLMERW